MKRKRRRQAANGSSTSKRIRFSDSQEVEEAATSSTPQDAPREQDPFIGQYGAFPVHDDDELSDDQSKAAMAYMRSVRSQAYGIPNLLVATTETVEADIEETVEDEPIYEAPYEAGGGYYSDGVYIAAPFIGPTLPASGEWQNYESEEEDADGSQFLSASEAYHSAFLRRFELHRHDLQRPPPQSILSKLPPEKYPTTIDPRQPLEAECKRWLRIIVTAKPHPAQLAAIPPDMVLRILPLVSNKLCRSRLFGGAKRKREEAACLTLWIWGLLGRLANVWSLDSEEVSIIRDLGKKAAKMIFGFERQPLTAREHDASPPTDDDYELEYIDERNDAPQDEGIPNHHQEGAADLESDEHEREDEALEMVRARRNSSSSISEPPNEQVRPDTVEQEQSDGLELARQRLLRKLSDSALVHDSKEHDATGPGLADEHGRSRDEAVSPVRQHGFATLDMILTVVGELYGQRDLLGARDRLWHLDGGWNSDQ